MTDFYTNKASFAQIDGFRRGLQRQAKARLVNSTAERRVKSVEIKIAAIHIAQTVGLGNSESLNILMNRESYGTNY